MKTIFMAIALSVISQSLAAGSDAEQPKSKRFKVSYVDTEKLPPLTVISKELDGRKKALEEDQKYIVEGLDAARLEMMRRATLRQMYFPIRVEDLKTGNIYEVQTDRRTIVAKSKDGKELWKVNPYVDAGIKLTPLQASFFKHPYICYFGAPMSLRSEASDHTLQVNFTSGLYGGLDLRSGKFHQWGSQ